MPTTSTLLNSHNPKNYHEDDCSLERGWSSFACGEKKRGHRLLDLYVLTICTHTHTYTHTSARPLLCCLQLDLLCTWYALLCLLYTNNTSLSVTYI
jgi:hypothetical protein